MNGTSLPPAPTTGARNGRALAGQPPWGERRGAPEVAQRRPNRSAGTPGGEGSGAGSAAVHPTTNRLARATTCAPLAGGATEGVVMKLSRLVLGGLAILVLGVAPAAVAGPTPLNVTLGVESAYPGMSGEARVRVVHASPDAPAVDVWVNGTRAFTSVAFNQVTGYAALPAGTYNVKVEPAGANGAGPFVVDANLTLAGATDYSVVATDNLSELTPVVLVDDNASPAAGSARIRFFHGSPDAPPVDVALQGGAVLFANVAFQQAGEAIEVPAGSYDLEARLAGTATAVLKLWDVAVEAGKTYTVFATGEVADGFGDRTLYLNGDRFRLEVSWTDFEGNTGVGYQSSLTGDTGSFWFFDPANVELVAKALDARGINGYYWLFFGSLTNVQFTLTVTDTVTGAVKTYTNEAGTFASVGDTAAFMGS